MLDRLIDTLHDLIPMRSLDPDVPVLDEQALTKHLDGADAIVLFYADWCGFCRAFLPTYEERADALPHQALAADISEYSDPRWEGFDVDTVPTVVAFQDGEEVARAAGSPGRGLRSEDLDRLTTQIPA